MISKKMEKALNQQIVMEGTASFIYLAMSSWCDRESLEGCKEFMVRQSEEERAHMLRIYDYMSEVDGFAITPSIKIEKYEWNGVREMFKEVYEHEKKVTKSIYELLTLAEKEQDYNTQHFLQWYVAEQREEENLMRSLLDKIKLIGDGAQSLYYIDKEVAAINAVEVAEAGAE